jgi:hypothetical protein
VARLLTDDDWKPFLQEGETVVWSGRGSAWNALPQTAIIFACILALALWYGYDSLMFPSVDLYCRNDHSYRCAKSFLFAQPALMFLVSVLVFIVLVQLLWTLGWLRHDMALTERRALWIVTFPWQKAPGSFYQTSLKNEALERWCDVRFGVPKSYFRFIGLSASERSRVVHLCWSMRKAL